MLTPYQKRRMIELYNRQWRCIDITEELSREKPVTYGEVYHALTFYKSKKRAELIGRRTDDLKNAKKS